MVEVKAAQIVVDSEQGHAMVLLKEERGTRLLPIVVGVWEGHAIATALQGVEFPRPLTYDLMKNILLELGARVSKVAIVDLHEDTFYGMIELQLGSGMVSIDSRPSDAIALALRMGAPIYAAEAVMETAGVAEETLPGENLVH